MPEQSLNQGLPLQEKHPVQVKHLSLPRLGKKQEGPADAMGGGGFKCDLILSFLSNRYEMCPSTAL